MHSCFVGVGEGATMKHMLLEALATQRRLELELAAREEECNLLRVLVARLRPLLIPNANCCEHAEYTQVSPGSIRFAVLELLEHLESGLVPSANYAACHHENQGHRGSQFILPATACSTYEPSQQPPENTAETYVEPLNSRPAWSASGVNFQSSEARQTADDMNRSASSHVSECATVEENGFRCNKGPASTVGDRLDLVLEDVQPAAMVGKPLDGVPEESSEASSPPQHIVSPSFEHAVHDQCHQGQLLLCPTETHLDGSTSASVGDDARSVCVDVEHHALHDSLACSSTIDHEAAVSPSEVSAAQQKFASECNTALQPVTSTFGGCPLPHPLPASLPRARSPVPEPAAYLPCVDALSGSRQKDDDDKVSSSVDVERTCFPSVPNAHENDGGQISRSSPASRKQSSVALFGRPASPPQEPQRHAKSATASGVATPRRHATSSSLQSKQIAAFGLRPSWEGPRKALYTPRAATNPVASHEVASDTGGIGTEGHMRIVPVRPRSRRSNPHTQSRSNSIGESAVRRQRP